MSNVEKLVSSSGSMSTGEMRTSQPRSAVAQAVFDNYDESEMSREPDGPAGGAPYAELHCLSNFSFLRGASHPEELVARAAELGYEALAITDRNSLAGVVRAHLAAKEHDLRLIIGAEITPCDAPPIVLLATTRAAYGRLARLITRGRLRSPKGGCNLALADIAELGWHSGLIGVVIPPAEVTSHVTRQSGPGACADPVDPYAVYRDTFGRDLFLAAELTGEVPDVERLAQLFSLSRRTGIPLVAAQAVHYHIPQRRYLQDVLTCIREKCTLATAGTRLFPNAVRHLHPRTRLAQRYAACPELVRRTVEIARRCAFGLDELRYEYPDELCPAGRSQAEYLAELTWQGARERYPDGVPLRVRELVARELALISELKYEPYFLTVWDLVRFARSRGILCQGRGSAANSAVCYCLGVTAVDPARLDVLFERFMSRERNEPPDIDIDFEHERREEVFQYIYEKYGRERAAITAEVITYRPRSAVRDVGKALGLSLDRVDVLAKALDWWSEEAVPEDALRAAGLNPADRTVRLLVRLVRDLLGFPRHLSQHVGGFVITRTPLCEIVPLENGGLPGRTFIEWDKDDIDALGILKVDCLALGMLTALRKCFELIHCTPQYTGRRRPQPPPRALHNLPPEDPAVYDMICAADTVGVFQIESRAQMSMLPRLKPRCFYDLVIEVAIVRPGPIQGGMIHPYLRRRQGREPVVYPSEAVRNVLEKTLGVPLFQEQVMRLAVVAAGFTPGEADQLRRSMAAWRRGGQIDRFETRLIRGMLENGYTPEFAAQLYSQIRGFGEYGFPESHAASFALLVYASAWLKCYYPAAFFAALLNSQPMGFYAPAQLVRDARRHGVTVRPVDVNASGYDCRLEPGGPGAEPALRLGFRLVRGLSAEKVRGIERMQRAGPFCSLDALVRQGGVSRETLLRLAAADAFRSLGLDRRQALWQILAWRRGDQSLFADQPLFEPTAVLPAMSPQERLVADYEAVGLSLEAHPLELVRAELRQLRVRTAEELKETRQGQRVSVAGLVTHRQRPGTAKGTVFMTLEDETGTVNLIIRPDVWERVRGTGRTGIALLADGVVERQEDVLHVQVRELHDLSVRLGELHARSRDFH
jgi:error-prone DNA polymerase